VDLMSRALMLLGFLACILAIAGLVVVIGRARQKTPQNSLFAGAATSGSSEPRHKPTRGSAKDDGWDAVASNSEVSETKSEPDWIVTNMLESSVAQGVAPELILGTDREHESVATPPPPSSAPLSSPTPPPRGRRVVPSIFGEKKKG
jgi:hypothetical protein